MRCFALFPAEPSKAGAYFVLGVGVNSDESQPEHVAAVLDGVGPAVQVWPVGHPHPNHRKAS